jgi:hypothetical protein
MANLEESEVEEVEEMPRPRRTVKDGVVISDLDLDKPYADSESALELILLSLSNSFNM